MKNKFQYQKKKPLFLFRVKFYKEIKQGSFNLAKFKDLKYLIDCKCTFLGFF